MSDSNLKIGLNTKTNFEFELSVKGIEVGSADVRFCMEKNGVSFQFNCAKKGDVWTVDVPALSSFNLKEGLYKYTIEVIANGYYFAPVKGTAEVAPAAEVSGNIINKDVKVSVSGIKSKSLSEKTKSLTKKNKNKVKPLTEQKVVTVDPTGEYQPKYPRTITLDRLQELGEAE